MRYFITFSYNGSKFNGFQRLKNEVTVQQTLEKALSKINKKAVTIKGAGRTDIGVHAICQAAHFDLDIPIPVEGLKKVLNQMSGPYITIKSCTNVSDDFHARFSVIQKTYCYRIFLGEKDPFLEDYYFIISETLNVKMMKKASKLFLGIHDFKNFVSGNRDDYTGIIYQIKFKKLHNILEIRFTGKSFYRYMVRNLVWALLDIGLQKREISDIEQALKYPNKSIVFSTAKSSGLYLEEIKY